MTKKRATKIDEELAQKIVEAREARGVTQVFMAKQIGVVPQQLFKYERGKDRFSAVRFFKILKALHIDFSINDEGIAGVLSNI